MGKLIGIGGGRYDNGEITNIAEYIVSLSENKNPKVMFLPTAGFDDMDGDEPIFDTFEKFGCSMKSMLLSKENYTAEQIENEIMSADIIYVGGGNLKFLMDTWTKTGADVILKKAFEKGKILSGYSSGMMCWFSEGYDDCNDGEFMFVDCLGLLPYSSCPHFEGGRWPTFEQAIKGHKYSAYAAENGASICYIDGKTSVICGNEGGRVYFFNKEKNHTKEIFGGEPQI